MNTGRTIQELIFYYDIDVNDPEYINKIDDLILRVISENQQKQTDEIFTLIRLQRYMIKKHYFLTKEGLKNE